MDIGYNIVIHATDDYGDISTDTLVYKNIKDAHFIIDVAEHFRGDNFGNKVHHNTVIGNLVDTLIGLHPEISPRLKEWLGGLGEEDVYPTDAFMSIIGYDRNHDGLNDGYAYYRMVTSIEVYFVSEITDMRCAFNVTNIRFSE